MGTETPNPITAPLTEEFTMSNPSSNPASTAPMFRQFVVLDGEPESMEYAFSIGKFAGKWAIFQDDFKDGKVWNTSPTFSGGETRETALARLSEVIAETSARPGVETLV